VAVKFMFVSGSPGELVDVAKEVKAVDSATEVVKAMADVTSDASIRDAFDAAGEVQGRSIRIALDFSACSTVVFLALRRDAGMLPPSVRIHEATV
jgi:hypothetical protein